MTNKTKKNKQKDQHLTKISIPIIDLGKELVEQIDNGIRMIIRLEKKLKKEDIELYNQHKDFLGNIKDKWCFAKISFENEWEARNYIK